MDGYLEDFSIDELKKIVRDIVNSEIEGNNVKFDIFPVTILEYYNDYLASKPFRKLEKVGFSVVPLRFKGGFRINSLNDIVIFLHHSKKVVKPKKSFFDLVLNSYHEARHINQDSLDKYSYEGALIDMENYVSSNGKILGYIMEHDSYFVEIDARMYSISKAINYVKRRYPKIYEKSREYINRLNREYNLKSLTYDIVSIVENATQIRKKKYKSASSMINNPIFFEIYLSEYVPSILNLFLNVNGTFKSVSHIISNCREHNVDDRIVKAFLSSKHFLDNVDVGSLSNEELSIVIDSLEYISSYYQDQLIIIDDAIANKDISMIKYLKMKKNIISRIDYIDRFLLGVDKGRGK